MAGGVNRVILVGNLGADPEMRYTADGTAVCKFSLATSRKYTGKDGQKQEKTEWHRVILWNTNFSKLADIAEKYCKKGDKVYIEGSIEYRSWQDREGQTKYTTEINGRELILLGGRSGGCALSTSGARCAFHGLLVGLVLLPDGSLAVGDLGQTRRFAFAPHSVFLQNGDAFRTG
mgnify:CR=1 FL=1